MALSPTDCPWAFVSREHGMNDGGKNDGKTAGKVVTITRSGGATWPDSPVPAGLRATRVVLGSLVSY